MLKACSYCGRIHTKKYNCPRKPKRNIDYKKYYDQDESSRAFRSTSRWTRASIQIRDRDYNLCQACIRNRYLTAHPLSHDSVSVHHIVPISEDADRALDPYNLITLCSTHHELAEAGIIPRGELQAIAKEQQDKYDRAFR